MSEKDNDKFQITYFDHWELLST